MGRYCAHLATSRVFDHMAHEHLVVGHTHEDVGTWAACSILVGVNFNKGPLYQEVILMGIAVHQSFPCTCYRHIYIYIEMYHIHIIYKHDVYIIFTCVCVCGCLLFVLRCLFWAGVEADPRG